MEKFKQKYFWVSPKYWKQKRSINTHQVCLRLIKEDLGKGESDFAKKVNEIIKERRTMQKCVYILCSPPESPENLTKGNRGFWLYFDPKRNPELLIESAGENGLSIFSYAALDYLTKENLITTEKLVKEVLSSMPAYINIEEAEDPNI